MITTFMSANELHAVHVIRQKGLTKIQAVGMCKAEDDVGAGVYQTPEWVFDGRPKYGETPVCAKCSVIINNMKTPPR
jgi:hypothetical protein